MSPSSSSGLAAIDWSQPWLTAHADIGVPIAQRAAADAAHGATATALQASARGAAADSVRFVPQDRLPDGEPYESYIFRTREVPTRDNLHDFFNGLIWLHCPMAKRQLNRLQAGEIERAGVGATRGPLRDALTLFDENGALLDAPPALWDALIARDWPRLFVTERALWTQARLWIFGHALLEKLMQPRKAATAHVLRLPLPIGLGKSGESGEGGMAHIDALLAEALAPAWLASKPFAPLPVLGIPGWCPENENFSFYDDSDVFRPRGTSRTTTTAGCGAKIQLEAGRPAPNWTSVSSRRNQP
ncbi:MAG: DUF3025 domain-containing protein [Pseudomonadota bacterium]